MVDLKHRPHSLTHWRAILVEGCSEFQIVQFWALTLTGTPGSSSIWSNHIRLGRQRGCFHSDVGRSPLKVLTRTRKSLFARAGGERRYNVPEQSEPAISYDKWQVRETCFSWMEPFIKRNRYQGYSSSTSVPLQVHQHILRRCCFQNWSSWPMMELAIPRRRWISGTELWDVNLYCMSEWYLTYVAYIASSKRTFFSHTRAKRCIAGVIDMFYMRMVNFVNGIACHGIIYRKIVSIIGRNILNCYSRYNVIIDNNLHYFALSLFCRSILVPVTIRTVRLEQ